MIECYFELARRGTTVRRELAAGLATFLTAAYIIFVNPAILSTTGMDKGALVTVTCLVAAVGTFATGLWPNAPFMMAPGMGLNAFFAFSVCATSGVPWKTALGVVFLSGLLFFLLALGGIREKILNAIPRSLRYSVSVGIGLFIAFIGLKEMGLITKSETTFVHLGNVTWEVGLGLIGFFVMVGFEVRKMRGGILAGIIVATLLGALVGKVSLPSQPFSLPAMMDPLFFKLDILGALKLSLLPIIFTFMYVDLFDSLGTLMAVCRQSGMIDSKGKIPKIGALLQVDALATMFGAVAGTSTTVTYIESAVGVAQGGRTGLTALFIGAFFLAGMFFTPFILAVPPYATAPALILVGIHMVKEIQQVQFEDWEEAVPAFLTAILMPLSFSIANGIMFGFLSHTIVKLLAGKARELNPTIVLITILSGLNLFLSH